MCNSEMNSMSIKTTETNMIVKSKIDIIPVSEEQFLVSMVRIMAEFDQMKAMEIDTGIQSKRVMPMRLGNI